MTKVKLISIAQLSDPYEVLARFKAGNAEALEMEMLARWGGFSTSINQKICLIQNAIVALERLVDRDFTIFAFQRSEVLEIMAVDAQLRT